LGELRRSAPLTEEERRILFNQTARNALRRPSRIGSTGSHARQERRSPASVRYLIWWNMSHVMRPAQLRLHSILCQ
jgi:hypothetical protein